MKNQKLTREEILFLKRMISGRKNDPYPLVSNMIKPNLSTNEIAKKVFFIIFIIIIVCILNDLI